MSEILTIATALNHFRAANKSSVSIYYIHFYPLTHMNISRRPKTSLRDLKASLYKFTRSINKYIKVYAAKRKELLNRITKVSEFLRGILRCMCRSDSAFVPESWYPTQRKISATNNFNIFVRIVELANYSVEI